MEFKIINIKVKENVVLSEENKPINPYKPIWPRLRKDKKENFKPYYPAAFRINEKETDREKEMVRLEVALLVNNAIPDSYELECIYESRIHGNEIKVFSGDFTIDENKNHFKKDQEITVPVYPFQTPDGFIGMEGNFHWTITRVSLNKKTNLVVTQLEIYWIYGARYNKIFRKGVPVEILRQIAHTCHIMGRLKEIPLSTAPEYPKLESLKFYLGKIKFGYSSDMVLKENKKWIIEIVVKSCFYRNPPRYNIHNGGSSFFDYYSFELYHYLNSINDPDAVCNCMDQAAVLQVYLMAIGIEKTSMCLIGDFGYIRLTNLVGRGLCNNPRYNELQGFPIVNDRDKNRKYFNYHFFCQIDNQWIVDSCIGPHIGNENKEAYIKDTVDNNNPRNDKNDNQKPTQKKLELWDLNYINWNDPKKNIFNLPLWRHSMDLFDYHNESSNEKFKGFAVCNWLSELENCSVLGKGWDIFFSEIIAGDRGAMLTCKLRKKGERVNIRIMVFSRDYVKDSIMSFFSKIIGAIITLPHPLLHYERGHEKLSLQSISKNPHHVLFIPEIETSRGEIWTLNILCDISYKNVTFEPKELNEWLRNTAKKNEKTSIDKELASLQDLKCNNETPAVNEKVKFFLNTQENIKKKINVFMDFIIIDGDGLQLIEETDLSLEFIARNESKNELLLAVVDKDTLLCGTRKFTINVKSKVKV